MKSIRFIFIQITCIFLANCQVFYVQNNLTFISQIMSNQSQDISNQTYDGSNQNSFPSLLFAFYNLQNNMTSYKNITLILRSSSYYVFENELNCYTRILENRNNGTNNTNASNTTNSTSSTNSILAKNTSVWLFPKDFHGILTIKSESFSKIILKTDRITFLLENSSLILQNIQFEGKDLHMFSLLKKNASYVNSTNFTCLHHTAVCCQNETLVNTKFNQSDNLCGLNEFSLYRNDSSNSFKFGFITLEPSRKNLTIENCIFSNFTTINSYDNSEQSYSSFILVKMSQENTTISLKNLTFSKVFFEYGLFYNFGNTPTIKENILFTVDNLKVQDFNPYDMFFYKTQNTPLLINIFSFSFVDQHIKFTKLFIQNVKERFLNVYNSSLFISESDFQFIEFTQKSFGFVRCERSDCHLDYCNFKNISFKNKASGISGAIQFYKYVNGSVKNSIVENISYFR